MHNTQRAYWARLLIFLFAVLFFYSYDQMFGDHTQSAKQAKAVTFEQVLDSSPIIVIGTIVGAQGKETAIVQVNQVVKGALFRNEEIIVALTKQTKHVLGTKDEYLFALAPSVKSISPSDDHNTYYGMMNPFLFQWHDTIIRAVSSDPRIQQNIQPVEMSVESFMQLYSK